MKMESHAGQPTHQQLNADDQASSSGVGYTALHRAARDCNAAQLKILLDSGHFLDVQESRNGNTPLHMLARRESEAAFNCAKLILEHQLNLDGTLINMKNNEGEIPLYISFTAGTVEMAKLLLNKQYKLDLSELANCKEKNILLQECRTARSYQILKLIVSTCSPHHLIQKNEEGQTLLHLAALARLPEIIEILVGDACVDISQVDNLKRTALHCAAINGSFPAGARCVEGLINWNFARFDYLYKIFYLYDMEDSTGSSALQYVLQNCTPCTVQKFLAATPSPQRWMSCTKLGLIYDKCPLAIKALMNSAFHENKISISSKLDDVGADFGPITGYSDPIWRKRIPQLETHYLKNAHKWDYITQKEILEHPLVQIFLAKKLQKLRTVFYLWMFWQGIWLGSFQLVLLTTYCEAINSKEIAYCASILMTVQMGVSLLYDVMDTVSHRMRHAFCALHLFKLFEISLASVAIHPILMDAQVSTFAQNCAAIGIIFSTNFFMVSMGKLHDGIGVIMEVLNQVVIQTLKVLFCCLPLLIGFTYAFVILFDDVSTLNTPFPGQFVKVVVMMTGDFEFSDMFKDGKGSEQNRIIRYWIFMSFLISVSIAFFNLLTGFALERVMELRERSNVDRIAKKFSHVHRMDSIIRNVVVICKCIFGEHESFTTLLRRHNVTVVKVGSSLQFETCSNNVFRDLFPEKRRNLDGSNFKNIVRSVFAPQLSENLRCQIYCLVLKKEV